MAGASYPYLEAAGSKIRHYRHMKHWTIEELATRIGTSISYLSQIERGRTNAGMMTYFSIAESLNVNITAFFSDETIDVSTGTAPDASEKDSEADIMEDVLLEAHKVMNKMPEDQRASFLETISSFVEFASHRL